MWAHLAKIALPEQALIPGQVDQSGVPWLDPHPPPGRRAPCPPGLAAVGLVDSEHRCGLRLNQHRFGVATKARCAVGHDTPWAWATAAHGAGRVPDRCEVANRLRKAKSLLMQRHVLWERNHNRPFEIEVADSRRLEGTTGCV
jgi:hypothetical protein